MRIKQISISYNLLIGRQHGDAAEVEQVITALTKGFSRAGNLEDMNRGIAAGVTRRRRRQISAQEAMPPSSTELARQLQSGRELFAPPLCSTAHGIYARA